MLFYHLSVLSRNAILARGKLDAALLGPAATEYCTVTQCVLYTCDDLICTSDHNTRSVMHGAWPWVSDRTNKTVIDLWTVHPYPRADCDSYTATSTHEPTHHLPHDLLHSYIHAHLHTATRTPTRVGTYSLSHTGLTLATVIHKCTYSYSSLN